MPEVAMNVTTAISFLSDIPSWLIGLVTLIGIVLIIVSIFLRRKIK
jgi:hypothetical protein